MSTRVRKIDNYGDFSRLRKKYAKKRLIIVKFSADWCVPCKEIAPTFERLSLEKKHRTLFLELDSDLNEKAIEDYRVERLPTFLFIRNEKVLKRFEGADEKKLEKYITRYSGEDEGRQKAREEKKPRERKHHREHREHRERKPKDTKSKDTKNPKEVNKPKRTVKYRKHGKKPNKNQ